MIRSALRAAVVANLGGRTDKTDVINTSLDLALGEFTKSYGWKELQTTSDVLVASTTLTFTDGVWDESELTLTKTGAFTSYTFVAGDHVYVSGGTGLVAGWYEIAARTSANVLTLLESPGADASDVSATLIGNPSYITLPTNTLHVVRAGVLNGANSYKLRLKTKAWLQERWPAIEELSHGSPKYAYEDKALGRLYLYPVSDANYSIRITVAQLRVTFAEDATANPITGLDLALIAWATSYAFQTSEQFPNAAWWRDQAELARARAELADRRSREELQASTGDESDELWLQSATPWLDPFVRST
jgi:hypothetical protein